MFVRVIKKELLTDDFDRINVSMTLFFSTLQIEIPF